MKDGSVKSDVELAWCVNETPKHESCGFGQVRFSWRPGVFLAYA